VGTRRVAVGFIVLAVVAIAACGGSDNNTSQATTPNADGDVRSEIGSTTAPVTALPQTTVALSTTTTVETIPDRPGVQHLKYEYGPIDIQPGQNNIDYAGKIPQPEVDGWIVGMKPDLRLADGTVPPVDVVHLHHGVWLNTHAGDPTARLPERIFAAGEEKTITKLPAPYGYKYSKSDKWLLNFMLHNLLPTKTQVWVTYAIDFVPADAPEAAGMVPAHPIWMDVQNGSGYPVFDVLRGSGTDGTFTYPDQADKPYGDRPPLNKWVADRDGVLIGTAGHLHPGGLHTDLYAERNGQQAHLFRSEAKYYEPAGAVSWDVSMTATPQDWLVDVKKGDTLSVSATYDSAAASWYESMGIMVVWMGDPGAPGVTPSDPFQVAVDRPGMLTHGHLKENDNHGGQPDAKYFDLSKALSGPVTGPIPIQDFVYGQGDMQLPGNVPTVAPGGTISFENLDAPLYNGIWHTITACKAPCNKSTGIAYPVADADIAFDSGELGLGGAPTANRTSWTIPANLPPGTYTYFCRIHPLMRGAFRVEQPAN
jgi:plastocyanin